VRKGMHILIMSVSLWAAIYSAAVSRWTMLWIFLALAFATSRLSRSSMK
jgi:hypothetical protein